VVDVARARTLWEEGTEPGRKVVALGSAATLALVLLDLAVNGAVTLLFDLGFVLLCVAAALLVRPRDFFTIGVFPPLLMLGMFWLVALLSSASIAHQDDGALQAVITGLAGHSGALVTGYGLCLACLAMRQRVLQASNRSGSPAPRRTTSGAPLE
jgi:hypothetical protein